LQSTDLRESSGIGTIIACLGAETSSGDFEVFEYLYPGLPNQKPLPQEEKEQDEGKEGEWIALVSGLEMGNSSVVGDLRSELLVEWLNGELGDQEVRFSLLLASKKKFELMHRGGVATGRGRSGESE